MNEYLDSFAAALAWSVYCADPDTTLVGARGVVVLVRRGRSWIQLRGQTYAKRILVAYYGDNQ